MTQPVWSNISFFVITAALGLIGGPWYLYHYGISTSEWLLFAVFLAGSMLSITMGYHRLFAHRTYKANPIIQFLFLFFGAAAFQQSALKWAAQHRTHHRFVDTDKDPYNIKKGFFFAHMGWLMFGQIKTDYENSLDLKKNGLIANQHRYYHIWSIGAGIITPLLIGAITGHLLGAFLIAVALRITLAYQGTFCINSVCHLFGTATYDIYSTAKDHWFAAILTFGEGYHNFHHRFPSDYRNGVRWYHWDPTKWLIILMSWFGLASNLKQISHYKIIAARLRAQNQRLQDLFETAAPISKRAVTLDNIKLQYKHLENSLLDLEATAINGPFEKLRTVKKRYKEALRQWKLVYLNMTHLLTGN